MPVQLAICRRSKKPKRGDTRDDGLAQTADLRNIPKIVCHRAGDEESFTGCWLAAAVCMACELSREKSQRGRLRSATGARLLLLAMDEIIPWLVATPGRS